MTRKLAVLMIAVLSSSPAIGQTLFIQDGVTSLPGGGTYDGTIDTEFRAANPTDPQDTNVNISIDQFDGGFQTQGAIRFENVLISDGGVLPDGIDRNDIVFAEFRIWKQSPTASDANIDFSRVVGFDTTSGALWDGDDTWASLGGDLIPDEFGLLDGDPITRDDVEASSTADFQDSGSRFGPEDTVVLDSNVGPELSSLIYTADADSEDVFDAAWDGTPEDLSRAIDLSFWRFEVTETIRDWFADSDPSTPGTQPNDPNYGWAINNDTGDGWDFLSSDLDISPESEFDALDPNQFRPALTIIINDGPVLDLDDDDDEDVDDFNIFVNLMGSELDSPLPTGADGDFNFDRKIDLDDFKFFKENFPGGAPGLQAAIAAASVPEPGSCVLAVFAMTSLIGCRRRSIA